MGLRNDVETVETDEKIETQTEEISSEEKIETQTEEKQEKIVVEDGDVKIRVETDEEDPGSETETSEDSEKDTLSKEEKTESDDALKGTPYEGKNAAELAKILGDKDEHIGKMSNEVGELRKVANLGEKTTEELRELMSPDELQSVLGAEQAKLAQMNEWDEGYAEQNSLVTTLNLDWSRKFQEELINKKFNSAENLKFLAEQKEVMAKKGFEMSDDEFKEVVGLSENYTENGKVTERSVYKALMDKYGIQQVMKITEMTTEKDVREKISKATDKVDEKIDVGGAGKTSRLLSLKNMSESEFKKTVDNMDIAELDDLYAKLPK